MTAPVRRRLLAAMGGAALAPSLPLAAAVPGADADLIALCNAAVEAQAASEACYCYPLTATAEEARPYEDRAEAFADVAHAQAWRADAIPAATLAGLAAKARMARALAPYRLDGTIITASHAEGLAWGVLEDLMRLAGVRP